MNFNYNRFEKITSKDVGIFILPVKIINHVNSNLTSEFIFKDENNVNGNTNDIVLILNSVIGENNIEITYQDKECKNFKINFKFKGDDLHCEDGPAIIFDNTLTNKKNQWWFDGIKIND